MHLATRFYIGGAWVEPLSPRTLPLINPATEEPCGTVAMGNAADVDRAVAAANRAFSSWAATPPAERADLLDRLVGIYERRSEEMAALISERDGRTNHAGFGQSSEDRACAYPHLASLLRSYSFEHFLRLDTQHDRILHEPIGICALITPWNWPMNQIAQKVAAALAAGCTSILKPSEQAPLSATLFTQMIDEAGFPPGVFNLIHGNADVGEAMARHRDVQMISLTGSGRAGRRFLLRQLRRSSGWCLSWAARGRISSLPTAASRARSHVVPASVSTILASPAMRLRGCWWSGRPIMWPWSIATQTAEATPVGDPAAPGLASGPPSPLRASMRPCRVLSVPGSKRRAAGRRGPWEARRERARYFARPTVFADVTPNMRIAREEIFGPVLTIIPFDTEEEAIRLANDTGFRPCRICSDCGPRPRQAHRPRPALRCCGAKRGCPRPGQPLWWHEALWQRARGRALGVGGVSGGEGRQRLALRREGQMGGGISSRTQGNTAAVASRHTR